MKDWNHNRFIAIDTPIDSQKAFLDRKTDKVFTLEQILTGRYIPSIEPKDLRSRLTGLPDPLFPTNIELSWKEEIARFQKILEELYKPSMPDLTVGDLSIVTEAKRKLMERAGQRHIEGDTVGDLSEIEPDHRGLQDLFVGKKVEANPLTESQKIQCDHARKSRDITDLRIRLSKQGVYV